MRHKLTGNLLALYGAHIARYLFPLFPVPYLATYAIINTLLPQDIR